MSEGVLPNRLSLIDTAYKQTVDVWAVFVDLDDKVLPTTRSRFWSLLKPGFQHVEIWKHWEGGAWLRFDTSIEQISVGVFADPPWRIQAHLNPTCVHVRKLQPRGRMRAWFQLGPSTCVELAKAFLGVSAFCVRTPYQLYRYLRWAENRKHLKKTPR